MTLSCDVGYWLSDRSAAVVTTCQEDGNWSDAETICNGISNHIFNKELIDKLYSALNKYKHKTGGSIAIKN